MQGPEERTQTLHAAAAAAAIDVFIIILVPLLVVRDEKRISRVAVDRSLLHVSAE